MKNPFLLGVWMLLLYSCAPVQPFLTKSVPAAPDYSKNPSWAALPDLSDPADRTPNPDFPNLQATSQVDIFFLHPTILLNFKVKDWNGDLDDNKLNNEVDESTILYQASAFNGSGKVYAPRYRQAHYRSFFTEDKASAKQALDIAYKDVKAAFEFYLKNYNQGRPIIIAAHSQGTLHAMRLMKEFFDRKPLGNKLVVAYLVGWPILKNEFASIPPCENPEQTGCFCAWRSFKYGYMPEDALIGDSIAVTNPLSWRMDGLPAPKSLNEGMIARNFEKILPQRADAQEQNGVLWVHKPKFPGSFFFRRKNYHIADYNLFYINLRKNAQHRVDLFWK
ncbi:MAG: DUF3089 domain-containing protein [Saprospiraceae bacterium]|nr:DUF3089 domain-containing protein [Saprospiraceae bacterium]MCF8250649.1 DUF3089 domain-containing protein [Saprospiraceae bacterium]MCF8280787.1 DUF3089 domain-containing protein [Bacteroidales bacterium]MCF8312501.1 DUF3089 domain-containing protein [Saprospiraceae bacterium]MCF8440819.1 DUF3089 domain-containing protein [Saprospiraceae bacterium]